MLVQYPIREQQMKSLIGEPTYFVLHDGTLYYGIIDAVKDGQLRISGFRSPQRLSLEPGIAQAQVAGFGLENLLFRGAMRFELSNLAFLFTLPSCLFMI